jgi:MFS transporter, DHA1 family, multidrug resistance protein
MSDWRRTLYTIWFTQFIAIAGFNFVIPFLPYYIQSLGVTDMGQVAIWSGLCASATALGLAIMAPVWGVLADRYGRKLMILRATFGGVVIMTLMGFVTSVEQLLFLRLMQGVFTGTITASTTLVASIAPDESRGSALGSLQTAIFLGTTLGPLFGGLTADTFGYRPSFWITGLLLLLSGIGVALFVHEDFEPTADMARGRQAGYRQALILLLASGGALLALLAARILLRAGTLVTAPVMALLVQSLLPAGDHLALTTGLLSGASAVGGALGAPIIGGWGDRWGHRRFLIGSGLAACLLYLPQALAPNVAWLIFWQLLCGFAIGGTMSTAMALLAEIAPSGREGVIFGLDASATGLASAAGPLIGASVAAGIGLRAPFVVAAAIMAAGTLVVILRVQPAAPTGEPAGLDRTLEERAPGATIRSGA